MKREKRGRNKEGEKRRGNARLRSIGFSGKKSRFLGQASIVIPALLDHPFLVLILFPEIPEANEACTSRSGRTSFTNCSSLTLILYSR